MFTKPNWYGKIFSFLMWYDDISLVCVMEEFILCRKEWCIFFSTVHVHLRTVSADFLKGFGSLPSPWQLSSVDLLACFKNCLLIDCLPFWKAIYPSCCHIITHSWAARLFRRYMYNDWGGGTDNVAECFWSNVCFRLSLLSLDIQLKLSLWCFLFPPCHWVMDNFYVCALQYRQCSPVV